MATLKKGMSGDEIKKYQNYLITLGYSCGPKGADGSFGSNTEAAVKAYQKDSKDLDGRALEVDGKIGPKTQAAIKRDYDKKQADYADGKKFTINLKKGMKGRADIKYMQKLLKQYGYYTKDIDGSFGSGMDAAVRAFQKDAGLTVDGIIGKKTWNAIVAGKPAPAPTPVPPTPSKGLLDSYTWISASKRAAIEKDLAAVDGVRREMALELLKYACDYECKKECRGIYMYGSNLYNTDRKINYADLAELEAKKKAHPEYFTNGRYDWIKKQIVANPKLPASDCSGTIVGLLREHSLVSATFDESANGLCSKSYATKIDKSALNVMDWCHRSGHIGYYIGGGYVVEFYGTAFGCALTKLNERKAWDFVKGKTETRSGWTSYWRPKYY